MYHPQVGDVVQINGLVQHTHLNGRVGRVLATGVRDDGGILVDLGDGEIVPVRARNLSDGTGKSIDIPHASVSGGSASTPAPYQLAHPMPTHPVIYTDAATHPDAASTPSQGENVLRPLHNVDAPTVYPGRPNPDIEPTRSSYARPFAEPDNIGRWSRPRRSMSGATADPAHLYSHPTHYAHDAQDAYERRRLHRAAKLYGDPAALTRLPPIPTLKDAGNVQISGAQAPPRRASLSPNRPTKADSPTVQPRLGQQAVMFVQDPSAVARQRSTAASADPTTAGTAGHDPRTVRIVDDTASEPSNATSGVSAREAELMRHIGHLAEDNQRLKVELLKHASATGRPLNHVSPAAFYEPLQGTRLGAMLAAGNADGVPSRPRQPQAAALAGNAVSPTRVGVQAAQAPLAGYAGVGVPVVEENGSLYAATVPAVPQPSIDMPEGPRPSQHGPAVTDYLRAQQGSDSRVDPLARPILSQPVAQQPRFLSVVDDDISAATTRALRGHGMQF